MEGGRNDATGSEIPNQESVNAFDMAAPLRKRVKGRRRARRKGRLSVVSAANEFEEEKKMKKREVEDEEGARYEDVDAKTIPSRHPRTLGKQAKELTAQEKSNDTNYKKEKKRTKLKAHKNPFFLFVYENDLENVKLKIILH